MLIISTAFVGIGKLYAQGVQRMVKSDFSAGADFDLMAASRQSHEEELLGGGIHPD